MPNRFTESIWGDEGFSAILSMKSVPEILRIIVNDTSPPLWNLSEWLFFNLFGSSEVVIRSLAFIFFLVAVFFAYKIGTFIWNKKTGILGAVLTFLNPFFFTYAFEGRMYSIMAMGVTGSMYFFLKLLKGDKKLPTKVGYVFFALWSLYSHHFAIFILFIQGLWFLIYHLRGKRKISARLFKLFLAIGIGYLPWIYPLYNQTKMVGGGFWLATPSTKDLFDLYGKYLGAGIDHALKNIALTLTIVILVIRKWFKKPTQELVLLSWFIGPILLTWLVSQWFQPIFFDRYLLYAIPGATILIASATSRVSYKIIVGLIAVLLVIDIGYFTHPTKRPFRELSQMVLSTRQPGDYIINWNSNGTHHLWETKYYNIGGPIFVPGGGKLPFFVGTALMEGSDVINELPNNINRVGVVTSGPLSDVVIEGREMVEDFQLPGINFAWYK